MLVTSGWCNSRKIEIPPKWNVGFILDLFLLESHGTYGGSTLYYMMQLAALSPFQDHYLDFAYRTPNFGQSHETKSDFIVRNCGPCLALFNFFGLGPSALGVPLRMDHISKVIGFISQVNPSGVFFLTGLNTGSIPKWLNIMLYVPVIVIYIFFYRLFLPQVARLVVSWNRAPPKSSHFQIEFIFHEINQPFFPIYRNSPSTLW